MNDADGTSLIDELANALQAMVRWSQMLSAVDPLQDSLLRRPKGALSAYYAFQSGEEDILTVASLDSRREV